jgi:UDP-glucuronate 4-epimerase
VVNGVILVLDRPASGNPEWSGKLPDHATSKSPWRIFNIGNGQPIGILDFINSLEQVLGRDTEKILLPLQLGDVEKTFSDTSKLIDWTNFQPKTPTAHGVALFAEWFKEQFISQFKL